MNGDSLLDATGGKSVVVGAAIDMDCLAGDEAAILAHQEQAGGGDLVDAALPAERDAGGVRQMALIPLRMIAPRIGAARRNGINPDVMRRKLGGEPAGHADQPHLRCR